MVFSMSSVASVPRSGSPQRTPFFSLNMPVERALVFLEGRAYNRATRKKILESKGGEASFGEDFKCDGGEGRDVKWLGNGRDVGDL